MLFWLAAQMFLGGGVPSSVAWLAWAVSDKELRLIGQLQRKTSEVIQRSREVSSLNRMA